MLIDHLSSPLFPLLTHVEIRLFYSLHFFVPSRAFSFLQPRCRFVGADVIFLLLRVPPGVGVHGASSRQQNAHLEGHFPDGTIGGRDVPAGHSTRQRVRSQRAAVHCKQSCLFRPILLMFHILMLQANTERGLRDIVTTVLVIPGRVIHLQRVSDDSAKEDAVKAKEGEGKSHDQAGVQVGDVEQAGQTSMAFTSSSNARPSKGERKRRACGLGCGCGVCGDGPRYRAMENHMDHFSEIAVSPSMGWEHFPNNYVKFLNRVWDDWQEDGDMQEL